MQLCDVALLFFFMFYYFYSFFTSFIFFCDVVFLLFQFLF